MPITISPLRTTVTGLASDTPPRSAINDFVRRGQRVATAYLVRRCQSGRLRLEQFNLTVEDLALDCLADLFQRDDHGRLVRVQSYLASVEWESLDEAGLEIAIRRLIFSAINEGLFRRYRESDPTVGRLIRTLKHHAASHDRIIMRRVRATQVVELRNAGDEAMSRPLMPPEVLEVYLHEVLGSGQDLSGVIDSVADLLETHALYAPSVTIPDLALCIRNVLARRGESLDTSAPATKTVEDRDHRMLVLGTIEKTLTKVRLDMESLYLHKRRLSPSLYAAYFSAVDDILRDQFVEPGTPDRSFREVLNDYVGTIGSKEYRQKHQAVLEYLVNLSRNHLLARLRPLF